MKNLTGWLTVVLGLGLVASAGSTGAASAARTRDVCIRSPTGGGSFNTFVLRDVPSLSRGGAIPVQGLFFTGAQKIAPVHGSAAMASDGTVRLGMFVHSTAESINDFTVAGVTDENFVGTLSYDNDGDFRPNGTLAMEAVPCSAIPIP
jgi:hypothetical protein